MNEPVLDLSEIMDLYKEDGRKAVANMRAASKKWEEIRQGGPALSELRKLAHQLRGSGRTYGFRDVSRIGKALEHMIIKLQEKRIEADDRFQHLVETLVERLGVCFE